MEDEIVKVALVDNHLLLRMGLRSALEHSGLKLNVVVEAASAAEFFGLLAAQPIDLVLLDILLPDMSGVEVARLLRKEHPEVKILVLSAESKRNTVLQLVEIGIEGFITKGISMEELCRAVEYVSAGAQYFGLDVARLINDVRIARDDRKEVFTKRESEIIELCASGLTGKEIAGQLNISIKTVECHKNNIFAKMGISNSVELARYAIKSGIIDV